MTGHKFHPAEDRVDHVRRKRAEVLVTVWEFLVSRGDVSKDKHRLSSQLVDEVIEQYIADWVAMKVRYRIPERIMPHKIAGLMAASIQRYKPIVPIVDEFTEEADFYANEKLAIINGLITCGSSSLEKIAVITEEEWFERWFNEFCYLLRRRNHTPESLVFIFQTLSTVYFGFPDTEKDLEEKNGD